MSLNPIRPWRNIDRRASRKIRVGKVEVGGDAPISVQSMTNTPTEDVEATVGQIHALEEAGADIVVCHMGLTTGGAIGAETALKLADCPALVNAWAEAALKVNKDILVLVHGGPVSMPEDAQYVLDNTETCHGFYGASSMERLPTEKALTAQTKAFKTMKTG